MNDFDKVILYNTLLCYGVRTGQDFNSGLLISLIEKHAMLLGVTSFEAVLITSADVADELEILLPQFH